MEICNREFVRNIPTKWTVFSPKIIRNSKCKHKIKKPINGAKGYYLSRMSAWKKARPKQSFLSSAGFELESNSAFLKEA